MFAMVGYIQQKYSFKKDANLSKLYNHSLF